MPAHGPKSKEFFERAQKVIPYGVEAEFGFDSPDPHRGEGSLTGGNIPGVHPPELAFDPEPFLKELEERNLITQVTVTQRL